MRKMCFKSLVFSGLIFCSVSSSAFVQINRQKTAINVAYGIMTLLALADSRTPFTQTRQLVREGGLKEAWNSSPYPLRLAGNAFFLSLFGTGLYYNNK